MKKSGLADSPFFSSLPAPSAEEITSLVKTPAAKRRKTQVKGPKIIMAPRRRDTMTPTPPPRNHDTTIPRNHDTKPSLIQSQSTSIERIRKAVKEIGKEAATHRFTIDEKRAIKKIVFDYENSGLITSENEITRIAVNFILDDFHQNGKDSLLDKVLQALNE
jgi:hypothetical protein